MPVQPVQLQELKISNIYELSVQHISITICTGIELNCDMPIKQNLQEAPLRGTLVSVMLGESL